MTDAVKISIIIPQSLKDKLNPEKIKQAIHTGLQAAALEVKAEASWYPGPSHKPVIWASEKQRRWYFANRKDMPPNYTRQSDPMSERMAKSWVIEDKSEESVWVVQSATYAEFVIGEKQQPQHAATGWKKISQVINDLNASGQVQKIFEKVISVFVNK
jgi:hypothetical protein